MTERVLGLTYEALNDAFLRVRDERDEAWRFIAALAAQGSVVVLAQTLVTLPMHPELRRTELRDGSILIELVKERPEVSAPARNDR
jgi:hypothetical protein